ncbi:SubName: Full=Related to protease ULP2 protein {ECO:0000313/EMBL:CCA67820.1} [Serendipita indica DSM 11827]|nr:SubName: Full=Related to protease ULP2 protein {ECO:0000313/EMBL:CCA67820.1} [Serendipita indica DSM 11827]
MDGLADRTTGHWQEEPTRIKIPGSQSALAPMKSNSNAPRQRASNPLGHLGLKGHRWSPSTSTNTVAPMVRYQHPTEEANERFVKRPRLTDSGQRHLDIDHSKSASTARVPTPASSLSATSDRDIEERIRGQRGSSPDRHPHEGRSPRSVPALRPPVVPPGMVAKRRQEIERRHSCDESPSDMIRVGEHSGAQRLQQKRISNMKDQASNGHSKKATGILGDDALTRSSLSKPNKRDEEDLDQCLKLDVEESFFGQHPVQKLAQVQIVLGPNMRPSLELILPDDVQRITEADIEWIAHDDQGSLFVCLAKTSLALRRLRTGGEMASGKSSVSCDVISDFAQFQALHLSFQGLLYRSCLKIIHSNREIFIDLSDDLVKTVVNSAPQQWSNIKWNWDHLHTAYALETSGGKRSEVSSRANRTASLSPGSDSMPTSSPPPRKKELERSIQEQGWEDEDLIMPFGKTKGGNQAGLETLEYLEKNTKRPTVKKTRSMASKPTLRTDDNEVILVYPFVRGLQITKGEHERLQPGEFLNDTLIEFGLRLWMEKLKISDPQRAEQIHVFSPFFYKKLKTPDPANGYAAVRTWTSKVDIFSKRYLVVPINEKYVAPRLRLDIHVIDIGVRAHWYLVVIMYPGNALRMGTREASKQIPEQNRERPSEGHPQGDHMEIDSGQRDPEAMEQFAPAPLNETSSVIPQRSSTPELEPPVVDMNIARRNSTDNSKSPATSAYRIEEQLLERDGLVLEEEDELMSPAEEEIDEEADEAWKTNQDSTYVLTFDSLGSKHPGAQRVLKDYLVREAKDKKGINVELSHIGGKLVKSPVQPNFCDCGLYLIKTAEKFLEKPDDFFKRLFWNKDQLTERHPLWDIPSFEAKRQELYDEISELSEKWKQERAVNQPAPSQASDSVEVVGESKAARPSVGNLDLSDDDVEIIGENLAPKAKKKGRRSGGYAY